MMPATRFSTPSFVFGEPMLQAVQTFAMVENSETMSDVLWVRSPTAR